LRQGGNAVARKLDDVSGLFQEETLQTLHGRVALDH
jgi:hypothetical protein